MHEDQRLFLRCTHFFAAPLFVWRTEVITCPLVYMLKSVRVGRK